MRATMATIVAASGLLLAAYVAADEAVQITSDSAEDRYPAWSPDGNQIAFERNGDIWVIPVDGGTATQVTTDPSRESSPTWSPDGTQIAFQSSFPYIWVVSSTGGDPRQVAGGERPAWSPDGWQLAYDLSRFGTSNRDIWKIPVAGGTARRMTFDMAIDEKPAWSPDARRIAFSSDRSGNWEIWVIGRCPIRC